jgi:hypothetical protein
LEKGILSEPHNGPSNCLRKRPGDGQAGEAYPPLLFPQDMLATLPPHPLVHRPVIPSSAFLWPPSPLVKSKLRLVQGGLP